MKLEMGNIDWALLREQKLWLLGKAERETDGLVCLIDTIQDEAVKAGVDESVVFGKDSIEIGSLLGLIQSFLGTCNDKPDSWYTSELEVAQNILNEFVNFIHMKGYRS